MNTLRVKPGWKTSEFWMTAVSFLFSGLYLVGLLDSNSQKEDLITESSRGVEAVILIIGQLTVLFRYIKGRTEVKKTWWNTVGGLINNEQKLNNHQEENNNEQSRKSKSKPKRQTTRTNKKQSRKTK